MRLVHRDVDERATRQAHFWRTCRVRAALTPLQHPCRRQQLGPMAHRRNRLAGLVERPHQVQHLFIQAQVLRRAATWDQQRVITLGPHPHEIIIQGKIVPWLFAVGLFTLEVMNRGTHGLPRQLFRAHRMHRVAHHAQGLERHHRFVIFDVVAHQHENFLRRHLAHSFG
ncbi:hypothetical protein D3C80_1271220 [compost metagenome]